MHYKLLHLSLSDCTLRCEDHASVLLLLAFQWITMKELIWAWRTVLKIVIRVRWYIGGGLAPLWAGWDWPMGWLWVAWDANAISSYRIDACGLKLSAVAFSFALSRMLGFLLVAMWGVIFKYPCLFMSSPFDCRWIIEGVAALYSVGVIFKFFCCALWTTMCAGVRSLGEFFL